MAKPVAPVTARSVRQFFADNPDAAKGLSDRAKHNLTSNGRLGVEVQKAYTAATRRRYTEGTAKAVEVSFKNDKGRKVTKFIPESQARALAGSIAGKRGPLSAKALAAAGEAFSKTL